MSSPEGTQDSLFDAEPGSAERPFRVSEVNAAVRAFLEEGWTAIWIEGELSNVTRSAAGHFYFTLNDEEDGAQISGVLFRGDAMRARTPIEAGARVQMRGRLSLYEPRGRFQFIARTARPAGQGELQAKFREIHDRLRAEGLFDPERKRPLPRVPRVVGVVTSRTGAAVHDIIRVTSERFPTRLVIADCRVQGEGSAKSILAALEEIQKVPGLEVIILSRGGGSAEDLWSFNEEAVARAIAACSVPVVSGVGHEVDTTIADFVADARAATPSNAAEIVIPDRGALESELETRQHELERAMETRLGRFRLRLERLQQKLDDPRYGLSGVRRRLTEFENRVREAMGRRLRRDRKRLQAIHEQVQRFDVRVSLATDRRRLDRIDGRLKAALGPALHQHRVSMATLTSRLDALSPLSVLGRGYAIAIHDGSGRALRRADEAAPGDRIRLRLAEGQLHARVEPGAET